MDFQAVYSILDKIEYVTKCQFCEADVAVVPLRRMIPVSDSVEVIKGN